MQISGVLKGNEGRVQDIACQNKLKPQSPSSKLIHNPMIKIKRFFSFRFQTPSRSQLSCC